MEAQRITDWQTGGTGKRIGGEKKKRKKRAIIIFTKRKKITVGEQKRADQKEGRHENKKPPFAWPELLVWCGEE